MRARFFSVFIFLIAFSCKAKDSTPEGLKNDLQKTMQDYLYLTQVNNDSSNVKYKVEDVNYFDDSLKNKYVCEFTVNLKEGFTNKNGVVKPRLDTTGKMKAYISRDLKTVERLY
jgi:hypothetical protein